MENNELEKELQKEFQIELEKQKLQEIINLIKREIVNYISKRTTLTENLVEFRKKNIEDYRDDEDKLIEYFDHERFVSEESFKAIDRKLRELTILQPSPYFGKLHFKETDYNEEDIIYIGRFGITPDDAYEPVVVDWRAPVASLFYAGKLGDAFYTAPIGKVAAEIIAKRQFIIKREELTGMFDSELEVKDDILQMVLSKSAGEKLKDIIMTIQAEQDNIIRQPREKTLIVDGIAGSGKTTIALHRVAYLLYNYRKVLQDKVLILGPNKIFMEYISTVLPSLGEIGVRQQTFAEFALDILELRDIMDFKTYMEKVISKDKKFIEEVLLKTSSEYICQLDKFIHTLNSKYFKIEDLYFGDLKIVPKGAIEELFNYYKTMPLFRRSAKIKRILFSKIKDARDEKVREIEKWYKTTVSSLNEEQKNIQGSDLSFRRRLMIREVIEKVMAAKSSLQWMNNESCLTIYNGLNNNKELTIDDLAPILYLKIKLEGLKIDDEIKHVVIDEAQDYSMLQFMVIKELTRCKGYTIVGDRNQRMVPIEGISPIMELQKIFEDVEYFSLNKSYRSTKEIMEYANKYLKEDKIIPIVRSGKQVVEKSFPNYEDLLSEILSNLQNLSKAGFESVAIVCRDIKETEKIASQIKGKIKLKVIDREDIIYNKGEVILPSYFAKGLEFDAVIVVKSKDHKEEDRMAYVMATRALHELYVYNI